MLYKYYEGTPRIINLSIEIGRLLGVVDATHLRKPPTELRKKNKVKTIRASLAIEGNTLSEDQVTAIMEHKRVIGPTKDIKEVENAIQVYGNLVSFDAFSKQSYLAAHRQLMTDLVNRPGQFRTGSVGVMQGNRIAHSAPPGWNVDNLMTNLFEYLKSGEDKLIIKSCVFHYEMELVGTQRENFTDKERLSYFLNQKGTGAFTRKDYLKMFLKIFSATATRDLKKGVQEGILSREGNDRLAKYQKK